MVSRKKEKVNRQSCHTTTRGQVLSTQLGVGMMRNSDLHVLQTKLPYGFLDLVSDTHLKQAMVTYPAPLHFPSCSQQYFFSLQINTLIKGKMKTAFLILHKAFDVNNFIPIRFTIEQGCMGKTYLTATIAQLLPSTDRPSLDTGCSL